MRGAPRLRLPAEWEPQSAVMLTWPHAETDWRPILSRVNLVFARIGSEIARRQTLLNVCHSGQHVEQIRDLLAAHHAPSRSLMFAIVDSGDTWARDHAALTTLVDGTVRINDFVFNGWGGKFDGRIDDAITGELVHQGVFGGAALARHALVLEGGAIETDGAGTLLATRSSVITPTRNPGRDQTAMERALADALGFERFLWLDHGDISGDDTDGHIDTLARFAGTSTILYATAPANDDDGPGLAAMAAELERLRTADGTPYRLLPLPFAGIHRDEDGRRLPATYANFLVINGAVLMPGYDVPQDAQAASILGSAFPGREVVTIDCRDIIRQSGSLHCLTMQFPASLTLHAPPESCVND
ncbi:MAG: agmatine deiminase family protein [Chromatiaceae bacterium]|nr:agmatine deiminase family protein [Chromatiaceae bacterium]